MIFSVYDYPSGKYRYYEAPAQLPSAGWFRQALGSIPTPEAIAAPLPKNAVYVGEGEKARGLIAAQHDAGLVSGFSSKPFPKWARNAVFLGLAFWFGRITK